MPTQDPGFAHYMARSARAVKPPDIRATEDGFLWVTRDEVHLLTPFGAVHKWKRENSDA